MLVRATLIAFCKFYSICLLLLSVLFAIISINQGNLVSWVDLYSKNCSCKFLTKMCVSCSQAYTIKDQDFVFLGSKLRDRTLLGFSSIQDSDCLVLDKVQQGDSDQGTSYLVLVYAIEGRNLLCPALAIPTELPLLTWVRPSQINGLPAAN